MNIRAIDAAWMRRALKLARRGIGRTSPNPPVGAVVVKNGRLIGSGYHRKAGGPHAEVFALREAGKKARGASLYVTLEPCSSWGRTGPCTEAIINAGIKRVVLATIDPNPANGGKGIALLRKAGITVTSGIEEKAAQELIAPFSKLITTGLPWVTLKMAMSLDGRICDADGRSKWITSETARKLVRKTRGIVDAVMIGSGTALADDPSLLPVRAGLPPWRVVVTSSGGVPARSRLLTDQFAGRTIIATGKHVPAQRLTSIGKKAQVIQCPAGQGGVSLPFLLKKLGSMGIMHVLCEGGARLAASLVRQDLADELWMFAAPFALGDGQKSSPVFRGQKWTLGNAKRYRFAAVRRVGDDLLIRLIRRSS